MHLRACPESVETSRRSPGACPSAPGAPCQPGKVGTVERSVRPNVGNLSCSGTVVDENCRSVENPGLEVPKSLLCL